MKDVLQGFMDILLRRSVFVSDTWLKTHSTAALDIGRVGSEMASSENNGTILSPALFLASLIFIQNVIMHSTEKFLRFV